MYTYKVTKRNKGALSVQANNPKEAIAKLYKTSVNNVELEKADITTGEYCVECLNGKKKTTNYYNIKDITFVNTAKAQPLLYMKKLNEWFDKQIDNWYETHIAEGDEDEPYYLYMDEYESDVSQFTTNSLLFYGYCTGHYENAVDYDDDYDETEDDCIKDFYFTPEELIDLFKENGIKVGSEVLVALGKDDNIEVVCKTITIEQLVKKLS